jgi:copper chaperone CopZ
VLYNTPHIKQDDNLTKGREAAAGRESILFNANVVAPSHPNEGRLKMRESELHIKGMHCESCAVEIKETLETTAGVFRADVTYGGKTANVAYDDAVVQEKTLIKKIQDLGYDATIGDGSQASEATA